MLEDDDVAGWLFEELIGAVLDWLLEDTLDLTLELDGTVEELLGVTVDLTLEELLGTEDWLEELIDGTVE